MAQVVALVSLALLAGGACVGPGRINRLVVTPTEVCSGDPVDVNWSAEGSSVELRQDPPLTLEGARASSDGVQSLSGPQDFDVVLTARGRPDAVQRRYVHVVTEGWTFVLSGLPRCQGDELRVDVDFHLRDPVMDARLQVLSVAVRSDRPLTIQHGALPPVTIPPGAATVLRGTTVSGLWTLTAALRPGEACGGDSPRAALVPAVIVSGTCGGLPRVVQRATELDAAPRCGNLGQACCGGETCEEPYQCVGRARLCSDPQRPSALTSGRRCNKAPATEDSRLFAVAIRDRFGCGQVLSWLADSPGEANECSREALGRPATIMEGHVKQFELCKGGRTRVTVAAFSDGDALACGRHRWPSTSVALGPCG